MPFIIVGSEIIKCISSISTAVKLSYTMCEWITRTVIRLPKTNFAINYMISIIAYFEFLSDHNAPFLKVTFFFLNTYLQVFNLGGKIFFRCWGENSILFWINLFLLRCLVKGILFVQDAFGKDFLIYHSWWFFLLTHSWKWVFWVKFSKWRFWW